MTGVLCRRLGLLFLLFLHISQRISEPGRNFSSRCRRRSGSLRRTRHFTGQFNCNDKRSVKIHLLNSLYLLELRARPESSDRREANPSMKGWRCSTRVSPLVMERTEPVGPVEEGMVVVEAAAEGESELEEHCSRVARNFEEEKALECPEGKTRR